MTTANEKSRTITLASQHLTLNPPNGHTCDDCQTLSHALLAEVRQTEKLTKFIDEYRYVFWHELLSIQKNKIKELEAEIKLMQAVVDAERNT